MDQIRSSVDSHIGPEMQSDSEGDDREKLPFRANQFEKVKEKSAGVPKSAGKSSNYHQQAVGVGILLEESSVGARVKMLAPGGAAYNSGKIKVNDILKEVNGVDCSNQDLEEIGRLICGPVGSKVKLYLQRGTTKRGYTVTLQRLPVSGNGLHEDVKESRISKTYSSRGKSDSEEAASDVSESKSDVSDSESLQSSVSGKYLDEQTRLDEIREDDRVRELLVGMSKEEVLDLARSLRKKKEISRIWRLWREIADNKPNDEEPRADRTKEEPEPSSNVLEDSMQESLLSRSDETSKSGDFLERESFYRSNLQLQKKIEQDKMMDKKVAKKAKKSKVKEKFKVHRSRGARRAGFR
ncbi:hypothetical protein GUITHDRAFT_101289 [Guillardia theta CCMP2712]|uniref:PDZ domain-containing protein n=2 Tax=Guillardia theta TaxID=55529 RepID=L1JXM7_GUITC|nr:hypothetical protein GUITHDRAFT_101289 [Guillardia theta CCMP2712]EKX52838.1 hypothetical protein GUITHDRAFT_101289 [Guillardia theta CCMP2712]|eukprot:XP_005839818.1 hypothetical protein GUITHDRAFT_101289 [Guillardia theta CCMP2712]